jgi:hypothetical protein
MATGEGAMEGFKDLRGATRAAVGALGVYMVLDALVALMRFAFPQDPAGMPETAGSAAAIAALALFVVLLACLLLVGRWIYRASANAHALSADMTIRPGWAVGWYFVPFANLVMPFQAMKEIWFESHEAAGLYEERETSLLGWWWGLWIGTNVLANIAFMFGGRSGEPMAAAAYVDLLGAMLNVPLCLVLIRLMRRLDATQRIARHAGAFL